MNGIRRAHTLGFRLTSAQRRAFVWLERAGYRFCIEFGLDNCVDLAFSVPIRTLVM